MMINPKMIIIGRESRGLSQSQLANEMGAKQGTLSKIESGVLPPSEDFVQSLSKTLNYPTEFFFQNKDTHGIGTINTHILYRKKQSVALKTIKKVEARINIIRMHLSTMMNALDFNTVHTIPKLDIDSVIGGAEGAAEMVRSAWLIPSGPILNVIETIENAGGIVVPFDFETEKIDATSFWLKDMPPLFFYNKNLKGDRLRFTLSHELGHMVMHSIFPNPEMEIEADQFASAFLMPSRDISPSLNKFDLKKAAQLKPYWKVSMGALIMKAKNLGKLSENQSRYLWMQMSANGWRTEEPKELDIAIEKPVLFKKLLDIYLDDFSYSLEELAKLLMSSKEDISNEYHLKTPNLRIIK